MAIEAIIYARFSKSDQVRGHTIDRQLDHARLVCADRDFTTRADLTFVEKGKSAFSGANRAKGSLLANLEREIEEGAHHGRTLVVEHLDRISRQGHEEVTEFLRACSAGGVSVATYDGSRLYPAGERVKLTEIIEIILKSELAREESEKKSDRIRKSFAAKRAAALDGAKVIASRPPSWIERKDGVLTLIKDRAEIVREAHRLAQSGFGTSMIAKTFNERGYRPWREASKGWHESYIGRMLTMRTAIGEYTSDKHNTRILDYYPPVITVESYNRTQAARAKRSIPAARGRRGTAQTNLFQGFARCAVCGGSMQMKPNKLPGMREKRHYPSGNSGVTVVNTPSSYLRCAHSLRRVTDIHGDRVCSNNKLVRYERLEAPILDMLMNVALDDRFRASELSQTRIDLAESERQLAFKQEQASKLAENLAETVSPTLVAMLNKVEVEIDTLRSDRERLTKALAQERGTEPSLAYIARIQETRAALNHPDHDTRRDARVMVHDALRSVISDMLCDDQANTTVIVADGLASFRVTNDGDIDWKYDASGDPAAIRAITTEAFAANLSTVEAVISRGRAAKAA